MNQGTPAHCRFCGSGNLFEVLDYGQQPISQRFLMHAEDEEYRHPLKLEGCESCGLIQVLDPVPPEELYEDSFYYLSASKPQPYLADEVEVLRSHSTKGSLLEVGCNDGSFLHLLRERGFPVCVGIEPNSNTHGQQPDGVTIHTDYFNDTSAAALRKQYGGFEFVAARDVLDHLPDIGGFFRAAEQVLLPDGYVYATLLDIQPFLDRGDCTIASEQHVNYFSFGMMRDIMRHFGFEPVAAETYNWAGGSIGLLAQRTDKPSATAEGRQLIPTARAFPGKVRSYTGRLIALLNRARRSDYEVFLYGAGWRGCRLANTHGVASGITAVIDDQVQRQGKLLPGSRLPVRSSEEVGRGLAPAICLLAVNQEHEQSVIGRFRGMSARDVTFLSITAPNDIWRELDRLEARLAQTEMAPTANHS